jgi:hypothetical protein
MTNYNYKAELRAIHTGLQWPEVEDRLGIAKSTQGKTLRRYLTGERKPRQATQQKIHKLYLQTMRANLYVNPLFEIQLPGIHDEWEELVDYLEEYPTHRLPAVLENVFYRVAKENVSPTVEYRVMFGHIRKPTRKVGVWSLLDSQTANERWILLYLIQALPSMKVQLWRTLLEDILRTLRTIKPGLYAVLNKATEDLQR